MTSPVNMGSDGQKKWDFHSAIEQIEACDFECEGGPLENNVAWQFLAQTNGFRNPWAKFLVGQKVEFEVTGELGGEKVSRWQKYTIVGCALSANTDRQTFVYSLSNDPIQPWHYGGGINFANVEENMLRAVLTEQVLA